jgi:GTPase SAR1 family protein
MRSPDPSIPDNDLRPPVPVHDEIEETPHLPPKEIVLKILVIGELGTGKTAVIQRYTRNTYSANYLATVCNFGLLKLSINRLNLLDWCRYSF